VKKKVRTEKKKHQMGGYRPQGVPRTSEESAGVGEAINEDEQVRKGGEPETERNFSSEGGIRSKGRIALWEEDRVFLKMCRHGGILS